jgi:hypothetical protein
MISTGVGTASWLTSLRFILAGAYVLGALVWILYFHVRDLRKRNVKFLVAAFLLVEGALLASVKTGWQFSLVGLGGLFLLELSIRRLSSKA